MAKKLSLNVAKTEFQLIDTKKMVKKICDRKPIIKIVDKKQSSSYILWQRPYAFKCVAQFVMRFFKTTTSENILNLAQLKTFTRLVVLHPQGLNHSVR